MVWLMSGEPEGEGWPVLEDELDDDPFAGGHPTSRWALFGDSVRESLSRLCSRQALAVRLRNGGRWPRGLGLATRGGEWCADCGAEPEMYLVRDRLWRSVGMHAVRDPALLVHGSTVAAKDLATGGTRR